MSFCGMSVMFFFFFFWNNPYHINIQTQIIVSWHPMRRPAYVIMVIADDLAPNGRQAISNRHADLNVTII